MAKYVTEMDVHVTSVIDIPDNMPNQITYDEFIKLNDRPVKREGLFYLNGLFRPLSMYDNINVKKVQLFITEEKDDGSGKKSESDGDVQLTDVAGQSEANA